MKPNLLLMLVAAGCAGPVECKAPEPTSIACGGSTTLRTNAIEQTFLRPDQWNVTTSEDWGCTFDLDVDAGVAHFVAQGELCTQKPAQDTSDDMKVIWRRCVPPQGTWLVDGRLRITVHADGGVDCL